MRTIAVVTMARSDYGIYRPVLERIQQDSDLNLNLVVGGMHLAPEFGLTVRDIEADGYAIAERVEMLLSSDSPVGLSKSMGIGTMGFATAFERLQPDMLLVLGDRFEMHAAVVAALPFAIPLAHIHGGEATEGLIDEAIRHSITKMSHVHFVATETYGKRVIQMGEEPWRVVVSGAPSLDNLSHVRLQRREELESHLGFDLTEPPLLVTFHPVTLEAGDTDEHLDGLFEALDRSGYRVVMTYPNADTHGRHIIERINAFAATRAGVHVTDNLGTERYFSLMNLAAAMVGNSSSGILEAASFHLPVVNIGNRQRGRIHGGNVIDVGHSADAIANGIQQATAAAFRAAIQEQPNPYGDGHAAEKIVRMLKTVKLDSELLLKRFYDLPSGEPCE